MALTLDQVKAKSAAKLKGLHPVVLAATNKLIERSYAQGVPILITQGLRTIAEQDALYAKGRTEPGPKVTNARGGYSNHNFGVAVDFCLLLPDGKSVSWAVDSRWKAVVEIAKELGFSWGGDWKSFKDYPHLEMCFGLTTAQYRAGKQPAQSKLDEVLCKLKGEEDEPMTKEEKMMVDQLKQLVKDQTERIEHLEKIVNVSGNQEPPAWAHEAIGAAKAFGAIKTSNDKGRAELVMLQVMHNVGLFRRIE